MHPIDDAYKRTADEISQRLSRIHVEVGEIERLATTKTATLYDGQITRVRSLAVGMELRIEELKSLIKDDCSAFGGEDPVPAENIEQSKAVSDLKTAMRTQFRATEMNSVARLRNSCVYQPDENLMPLRDHQNRPIPGFPATASHLQKLTDDEVKTLLKALELPFNGEFNFNLEYFAFHIGISEALWYRLGYVEMYTLPHMYLESQKSL